MIELPQRRIVLIFALLSLGILITLGVSLVLAGTGQDQAEGYAGNDSAGVLSIVKDPTAQTVVGGETAVFTVQVANQSNSVNLKGVTISDPLVPDCDRIIGNLAANSVYPPYQCGLQNVQSAFTNIITVTGANQLNDQIETASDSALVELFDLSVMIDARPSSLVEPGGQISFTVTISNSGSVSASLKAMSSPQFGNLTDPENSKLNATSCPPPSSIPTLNESNEQFQCGFSAHLIGQPGTLPILVRIEAEAASGQLLQKEGEIQIQIVDQSAEINVVYEATDPTVVAPGSNVNFQVEVVNTSSVDSVTILSLEDNQFGSLNNAGNCSLPQILSPQESYLCAFTEFVGGETGDSESFVLTVSGIDDDNPANSLEAQASTSVLVTQPSKFDSYVPTILKLLDEPNDSCMAAYPVAINRDNHFMPDDIDDWYFFELETGGELRVELTDFTPLLGQIVVYRGASCNTLDVLANNGNFLASKIVDLGQQESGPFYVRVFNEGPTSTENPYRLFVEFVPEN